jgi:hypothetical protein
MEGSAGPLEVVRVQLEGEGGLREVADGYVEVVQLVHVPEADFMKP